MVFQRSEPEPGPESEIGSSLEIETERNVSPGPTLWINTFIALH